MRSLAPALPRFQPKLTYREIYLENVGFNASTNLMDRFAMSSKKFHEKALDILSYSGKKGSEIRHGSEKSSFEFYLLLALCSQGRNSFSFPINRSGCAATRHPTVGAKEVGPITLPALLPFFDR